MANFSLNAESSTGNLNFSTAQKIIYRLLNHERIKTDLDEGRIKGLGTIDNKPTAKVAAYTKKEIAEKLGLTLEELDSLKSPNFYENIINKISLYLIRLYCSTKFTNGEYGEK
jgi:hypothetical protein